MMDEEERKFGFKDIKVSIKYLKKGWHYVAKDKKSLFLLVFTSVLFIPLSILGPILSARIITDLNGELYNDLIRVALFLMIAYSIEAILRFFSRILYEKYTIKINYELQKDLMNETFKLNTKCYDENGTGVFIDRLYGDTYSVVLVYENLSNQVIDFLTNMGIIIVVYNISKIMLLFYVIKGIKTIIFSRIRMKLHYKRYKEIKSIGESNTGLISELIRGSRDIKVLNANSVFIKKFDERINKANDKRIEQEISDEHYYTVDKIVDEIFTFLFYLLGVFLISENLLLPANFIVLYMYGDRVSNLFYRFMYLADHLKDYNISASRIYEIIDGTKFKKETFGKTVLKKIHGDFEFRNVHFGYAPEKEVLHGISFKVKANETVSFVGRSGSGKTTVFSLLDKLYDIEDGHIFIDGHDINSLTKNSIRNNMSMITQNPYIFNLSIRDNLLLVRENVTEKEMIRACKTAQLHDFIMSLPKGYDTVVGEGGVILSGGERQRLAIARALIKKTEIILFDEATSSLDNETQEKIQKAIHNLKGKYTILIIAHRLSTVINSDRIIMIDKGKIVGNGSHKDLLKNNKKYQKLYKADILKEDDVK